MFWLLVFYLFYKWKEMHTPLIFLYEGFIQSIYITINAPLNLSLGTYP
jgi:hypothetical protein